MSVVIAAYGNFDKDGAQSTEIPRASLQGTTLHCFPTETQHPLDRASLCLTNQKLLNSVLLVRIQGKAGKYTDYSESTGITKVEGQSTMKAKASDGTHDELPSEPAVSNKAFWTILPTLTRSIRMFATERDWSRYHKPRSLTLALLGELGELAELVQFRDDTLGVLTATQLDKLGQEIADVSIYLLRLADVFGTKMEEPSAGSR